MIKAIFLDLQGVITKEGRMFSENLPKEWEKYIPREETVRRYYEFRLKKRLDKEKFFLGIPEEKKLSFLRMTSLTAGAKEALNELHKKYKLYIASNHLDFFFEKEIEKIGVGQYFEKMFVSKDLGVAKPDARVYEIMLKEAKVKASEAIFVDDTKTNLKAAKDAGLTAVWMNIGDDNPRNEIDFIPDYEIKSLRELAKIVLAIR